MLCSVLRTRRQQGHQKDTEAHYEQAAVSDRQESPFSQHPPQGDRLHAHADLLNTPRLTAHCTCIHS